MPDLISDLSVCRKTEIGGHTVKQLFVSFAKLTIQIFFGFNFITKRFSFSNIKKYGRHGMK